MRRDSKAKRRDEQVTLSNAGWYPIIDNIADLAEAIYRFEDELLRIAVLPEIANRLGQGQNEVLPEETLL